MDVRDYLVYTARRGVERMFAAAKALPGDKLDWKPAPGARSALDQLQEVATVIQYFEGDFRNRSVVYDPESAKNWFEERAKITSMEELEAEAEKGLQIYEGIVREWSDEELDQSIQMSFPGDWKLADLANYHPWNAGYHEGQIYYIGSMLDEG